MSVILKPSRIRYFKVVPSRMSEEQNDFYKLGDVCGRCGGAVVRESSPLTASSLAQFVEVVLFFMHTSDSDQVHRLLKCKNGAFAYGA